MEKQRGNDGKFVTKMCEYPGCTGVHDYSAPVTMLCPDAHERKKAHYNTNSKRYIKQRTKNRRKSWYGLSHQDVLELFESSDGLCALCYESPATVVDHDHETGRVRGALCHGCNVGLGHVQKMGATSPAIEEYLITAWR